MHLLLLPLRLPATRIVRRLLGCLLLAGWLPWAAQAQGLPGAATGQSVLQTEQVRAELLAHAPAGAAPGQQVWVGLKFSHAPQWHSYWKNSGDSGLPTSLQWTLPPGVSAGPIAWPTPRKFALGKLANYGYDGTVLLPVPLHIGPDFTGAQLNVQLHASWLVCRKECIPGEGQFSLSLPVHGSTALHAQTFAAAFAAAPQEQSAAASSVRADADFLHLSLDGLPAAWLGRTLELFPETGGLITPGSPWTQAWDGPRWSAQVPLSPYRSESPSLLPMVLTLANPPGTGAGSPGVRMEVPMQGSWPAVAALPAAVPDALTLALQANAERAAAQAAAANASVSWSIFGLALLGALLGGMILNLMPCVFPVLTIKVLAFARHAEDRRAHRLNGLAYSAGVLLSFVALGGLLLALRAGGEQLGWGFQLQSPALVAALVLLFSLIGLNLAGVFDFGRILPSRLSALSAKNPNTDAFLTGVLATAIASPCTAPFMGASLGLAIGLPPLQALAVFAVLGLGMALPYLLASWVPAVARALPRPGPWMLTLRQFMAFPMFATVVWLLWVLGQQSSIHGVAALLLLVVVLALLLWALGLSGRSRTALAGLSLLGLLWLGWALGPHITRQALAAPAGPAAAASDQTTWEAWSPQRQLELLAQGRPVFVDFTAAWCVTCLYNKHNALADASVLRSMAAHNVALLRADWTRHDPAITAELARLGRSGIPVYALHQNGKPTVLLSELLSAQEIHAALARL